MNVMFDATINVPLIVGVDEMSAVLRECAYTKEDIVEICANHPMLRIPIKKLIMIAELSKLGQNSPGKVSNFTQNLNALCEDI
jgi:hypothetical protein